MPGNANSWLLAGRRGFGLFDQFFLIFQSLPSAWSICFCCSASCVFSALKFRVAESSAVRRGLSRQGGWQ